MGPRTWRASVRPDMLFPIEMTGLIRNVQRQMKVRASGASSA